MTETKASFAVIPWGPVGYVTYKEHTLDPPKMVKQKNGMILLKE